MGSREQQRDRAERAAAEMHCTDGRHWNTPYLPTDKCPFHACLRARLAYPAYLCDLCNVMRDVAIGVLASSRLLRSHHHPSTDRPCCDPPSPVFSHGPKQAIAGATVAQRVQCLQRSPNSPNRARYLLWLLEVVAITKRTPPSLPAGGLALYPPLPPANRKLQRFSLAKPPHHPFIPPPAPSLPPADKCPRHT